MRNARALLLLEMCFGLPRLLAVPRTVPLSLEEKKQSMFLFFLRRGAGVARQDGIRGASRGYA